MKAGYRIESTTHETSRFIYQFNFEAINVIGEYGFKEADDKYKTNICCTGVWKIKQLKN